MSNIDKYETRKKMVYDFMCDDMYVPMKIKELCIVLGAKKRRTDHSLNRFFWICRQREG